MASTCVGPAGMVLTDHTLTVPLDHRAPEGRTIEVFAREVVAVDREHDDLPWLVFLQGGPGGKSPRPTQAPWLATALKTHRMLLLDQRGTGRSTPITATTVAGMSDPDLAAYLRCFRADAIVADCEALRAVLNPGRTWTTLAQSYGGWITLTYLSQAPEGLAGCLVMGGLPGVDATAADVYARTYPRVAAKNAEFYTRYPEEVARVRAIADHLESRDVRLPDGDRLTPQRLRFLGSGFGMSHGYDDLHWLLEEAWHGSELSEGFLHAVMAQTGFVDNPLFPLQEYCYASPTSGATGWAAAAEMARRPEFAADATPLLLTGEMFYPWMFAEIKALQPFAGAADLLASYDDWPASWDLDVLAANRVPVHAAVYFDDMYVDSGLQLDAAARVGNVRTWVTNEFEHDGVRASSGGVVQRLLDMLAGRV